MTDDVFGRAPVELVTVYTSGSAVQLAIAESILRSAEVEFMTRGGAIQELFGLGRFPTGHGLAMGPVEIQVRAEDAADARAMLANLVEPAEEEPWDDEELDDEGEAGE